MKTSLEQLLQIKISEQDVQQWFSGVQHKKFESSVPLHWHIENGSATPQSFCWLFCWAKTGKGSQKAQQQAVSAFNAIFRFTFNAVDCNKLHDFSEKVRYRRTTLSDMELDTFELLLTRQNNQNKNY
jgi:hypothetical protein